MRIQITTVSEEVKVGRYVGGDQGDYFLQMGIHGMHSSGSEKLKYVEIGMILFAMSDPCLEFRQFGEAAVVQHIFYFDKILFDDSSGSYGHMPYFGIPHLSLRQSY